jgi:hypothetical protein
MSCVRHQEVIRVSHKGVTRCGHFSFARTETHAASAPDRFDFQEFSHGDLVEAVTEQVSAESIPRVIYPDDSTVFGQELRFLQEYFSLLLDPRFVETIPCYERGLERTS